MVRSVAGSYPLALPAVGVHSVIEGAARVSGAVADAVLEVDRREHDRRVECGLGGVEEIGILDALMCMPTGAALPLEDFRPVALRHLRRAPYGCLVWSEDGSEVRRLLNPVCSVSLVVVRAAGWRSGLWRAAAFEPFARRVVVLDRPSKKVREYAWEADASGTGLWIEHSDNLVEQIVPPGDFVLRYVKPARWRFRERAYAAWLTSTGR
jgi:hypothetical protein